MNDRLNSVPDIAEQLPVTEPLPVIWERREARPLRATARDTGLSLVPRVRPIGRGGVADMLAIRRHQRRMAGHNLRAA